MGEEKKEGEEGEEIVMKVDMHCEACARKVARSLKGFQGVEEVRAERKTGKVVVKGKGAEPLKVRERLHQKTGRQVQLLSPFPNPISFSLTSTTLPPLQPPPVVNVVLNIRMHCEACAQVLQKRIRKIKGVETVETNLAQDEVRVKGSVEAAQLVNLIYKKTGKQAAIVKGLEEKKAHEEEEKKKEEEKKEDEKEGGEGKKGSESESEMDSIKRMEHWPSKYYMDYANYDPIFSDENPNSCSLM